MCSALHSMANRHGLSVPEMSLDEVQAEEHLRGPHENPDENDHESQIHEHGCRQCSIIVQRL